ncbi:MAG: hypothetical protein H0W86_10685 [Armatimonadetes bacterium]|nr:hypothetical protein [Armatimonadota bacterium]
MQNNIAQLSLLLGAEPAKARAAPRQLHEKEPQNAAFASTYAFALYQSGDAPGAATVMKGLSSEQLRDPAVAAYYVIILARINNSHDARRYLELGREARLLPEEENLLHRAQKELTKR